MVGSFLRGMLSGLNSREMVRLSTRVEECVGRWVCPVDTWYWSLQGPEGDLCAVTGGGQFWECLCVEGMWREGDGSMDGENRDRGYVDLVL